MKLLLTGAWAAAMPFLAVTVTALFPRQFSGMVVGPMDVDNAAELLGSNGTNGWGTFDQRIDHSNPSLGTFKQRFWYGTQYWKGPGSPIFLVNPGEQAADRFNVTYTTLSRLPGLFAKEMGGAVVVLEHRYWGDSSPYDTLTEENLKYLTLENSIADNTYFVKNWDAPWEGAGSTKPDDVPWVYSGGSYSGALAGWIAAKDPAVFWALHGTSGVVEAVYDFWEYFVPVQEATPANCSKDLDIVINYIDGILMNGTDDEKLELKAKFLLEDLADQDFGAAIEYGPWQWQGNQFYSENSTGSNSYYDFCDYIENVWPHSTNGVPGAEGVGECKALDGYAKWFKEVQLPDFCFGSYEYSDFNGTNNTGCFQFLNASNPWYQDLTPRNTVNRQWMWMLCNEPFGYWQNGAPRDRPSMVSRVVDNAYGEAQCALFFPNKTYGQAEGRTAADVNAYTGGWSVTNMTRLMITNGQYDPWRDSTVSSISRPGGPLESTPEVPVRVIPGGFHCSDLYGQNWAVNVELKAIVNEEVANIKEWVGEFYDMKRRRALERRIL